MGDMARTKVGIDGIDDLMEGGIPSGHLVLLSGHTGTGKTILGMEYLVRGAEEFGEKGMYVTFEQRKEDLLAQSRQFGWDLEGLERKGLLKIESYALIKNHVGLVLNEIEEKIKAFKPKRFVFDSISTFSVFSEVIVSVETLGTLGIEVKNSPFLPSGHSITRKAVMDLFGRLRQYETTALLISELTEGMKGLSRDTVSEFVADGVILLHYVGIAGEDARTLTIRKMRGTGHSHDFVPYDVVSGKGIVLNKEGAGSLMIK